jgi:hypothetical protein
MSLSNHKRLLALDIRASRLGFAVFSEAKALLDWGVSALHREKRTLTLGYRFRVLLNTHKPRVIIARARKYHTVAASRRFAAIVRRVREASLQHSAAFVLVEPIVVQRHFASLGSTTKYGIAARLAEQFSQLSWRLPHRRKPYENERSVMAVFDAVATAIAYLGK